MLHEARVYIIIHFINVYVCLCARVRVCVYNFGDAACISNVALPNALVINFRSNKYLLYLLPQTGFNYSSNVSPFITSCPRSCFTTLVHTAYRGIVFARVFRQQNTQENRMKIIIIATTTSIQHQQQQQQPMASQTSVKMN